MGPVQFTGIGSQVDFVRGAARSRDGKAIIALPSTAKKGAVSRIVAALAPGTAVTTMRADVDYIVTEHGVAHLRGLGLRKRTEALIQIADPAFRDQIREEAAKICDRPPPSSTARQGELERPSTTSTTSPNRA